MHCYGGVYDVSCLVVMSFCLYTQRQKTMINAYVIVSFRAKVKPSHQVVWRSVKLNISDMTTEDGRWPWGGCLYVNSLRVRLTGAVFCVHSRVNTLLNVIFFSLLLPHSTMATEQRIITDGKGVCCYVKQRRVNNGANTLYITSELMLDTELCMYRLVKRFSPTQCMKRGLGEEAKLLNGTLSL